jgi:yecA family protein
LLCASGYNPPIRVAVAGVMIGAAACRRLDTRAAGARATGAFMSNSAATAITHAELGVVLDELKFGVAASDLHGSLTGFLCGGGVASPRNWLQRLELEPDPGATTAARMELLERLFRDCSAQLSAAGFTFEPLLPGDDDPLTERADALVQWCRGFLGGLGLAGVNANRGLSEDAGEILRDFATIAASSFEYDDAEEDENALTEVLEFIRVSVLLLHAELALSGTPAPADPAAKRLH